MPTKKIRAISVQRSGTSDGAHVLVGSEDGAAYMLNAAGELEWSVLGSGWVLGTAFVSFDETAEPLAVIGGEQIKLLDLDGATVERVPCAAPVTSMCVGTFAGTMAVLSGHEDGGVQAYTPKRGVYWRASCPKRVVSLQCCDVDLDGRSEVVAASEDTSVYVFGEGGDTKDRVRSTHWIISLAVGDVYGDGTPRVVIAGFDGDVQVYGSGKAAALRVRRRGILGLEIGRLIAGSASEQFVIGSSDQRVAIFDPAGRELWRFRTSYGHRVVRILPSDTSPSLVVGAADGKVHCVALEINPGLRQRIIELARSLPPEALAPETMSPGAAAILADAVDMPAVRHRSCTAQVRERLAAKSHIAAAEELCRVWHSGVEESWKFDERACLRRCARPITPTPSFCSSDPATGRLMPCASPTAWWHGRFRQTGRFAASPGSTVTQAQRAER